MKGLDAFLYLLFEHQSTPDPMMVFRLLCYMVNIWKECLDQNPDAKCLPAIFPAVLYHGKQKWKSPRTMCGMIDGADIFSEYLPDFTYKLYDLGDYPDEMLMIGGHMALNTVLYLFKHIFDRDFGQIFGKAVNLLKQIREKDESVFLDFLEWVLRYTCHARNEDESTVRGYIDREVEKLNDEKVRRLAMTVAEQIEKRGEIRGEIKGASSLLYSMLQERFGTVSPALEAKLRNADTNMLNKFGMSLFGFRKIRDAEKWWDDCGKKGNA
ncbi:MAG: Rpn family recombination-promoting nuclease/putative transposase [Desulfococcaceae bacterium]